MQAFSLFVQILLTALGIYTIASMICRVVIKPKKEIYAPLVLPVGAGESGTEQKLRWGYWQVKSGGKYGVLYILDTGMDTQAREICQRFTEDYAAVEIGDFATLKNRLGLKDD